jgi:hypothetical protein
MKHFQLHRLKRTIGAVIFGIFFPNENKKLEEKDGIGKQSDLVLVSVPPNRQTAAAGFIRTITGWTVKDSTAFVKKGEFPKVIIYNVKFLGKNQLSAIRDANILKIVIKTY